MKFKKSLLAGAAAVILGIGGLALAQPVITYVQGINANDAFLDIVNGVPQSQSQYASAALLGNYSGTLGGNNPENALIGGDATTNLWQRGTTGASQTTTVAYGGPDRWAYWSGASTAMTVSRDSTAADLPGANTYQYAFKMARTSAQTGLVQMCMMQEVESANSFAFAGQTAEIDFHATAGANFSAASSNLTVYLISGTSTDEGISKAAFNLNAGGGGSSQWTGQVNTGVTVGITTSNQRYTVAVPVPAAAQELAVALCYTPVGTAGTNDYVAFSGIQLTRNSALTTAAGTGGIALTNDVRAKAFARRSQALETTLQQRYYYQITESQSTTAFSNYGTCIMSTSSIANCQINFPTTMRVAPTMTYATGFAASATTASSSVTACTAVTTTATLTGNTASPQNVIIDCASSAGFGAAGTGGFLWDQNSNSAAGRIKASAEL